MHRRIFDNTTANGGSLRAALGCTRRSLMPLLHYYRAAVGRFDTHVFHLPALRVGDGAGGLGLDLDVLEFEIHQRRARVGAHREGALRAGRFQPRDSDLTEMRQPQRERHHFGQHAPVSRHLPHPLRQAALGQLRVTVTRIPVERNAHRRRHAHGGHVTDVDVLDGPAARARALEQDPHRHRAEYREPLDFDVAYAARSLAPDGHPGGAAAYRVVVNLALPGGPVDAQAVRVAARLEADRVVVAVDIAVRHQYIRRGIDIDAIRTRPAPIGIIADREPIHRDALGVADVHRPEARPFEREPLQIDIG